MFSALAAERRGAGGAVQIREVCPRATLGTCLGGCSGKRRCCDPGATRGMCRGGCYGNRCLGRLGVGALVCRLMGV